MNTKGTPMKPTTALLALITLAAILTASRADAQTYVTSGSRSTSGTIPPATHTNFPSYSYWTAAYYGYPPRKYIGLGSTANDFPYYGRPYGSPSDPWSWPAMAGYPNGVPTRYYPVLP
jgi:hypothetical protein